MSLLLIQFNRGWSIHRSDGQIVGEPQAEAAPLVPHVVAVLENMASYHHATGPGARPLITTTQLSGGRIVSDPILLKHNPRPWTGLFTAMDLLESHFFHARPDFRQENGHDDRQ